MNGPGPNADPRFVDYYAQGSISETTMRRLESTRRATLAVRRKLSLPVETLEVVDVGCGAGPQALMWAQDGHRVYGIDISAPLIGVARQRAEQLAPGARFEVGSATALPMADASVDVVLLSELLEHMPEWMPVVDEALRILRPGGVVYISTTNRLCPVQEEFHLPMYSWYPRALKKYCERKAVTTHGHWVQFASFPAVHWFSFYELRDYLDSRGFAASDRFDEMEVGASGLRKTVVDAVRKFPPLRFIAQVLTPYTLVVGYRRL